MYLCQLTVALLIPVTYLVPWMFKAAQTFRSAINVESDARKSAIADSIMHTSSKTISDKSIAHKSHQIHHRRGSAFPSRKDANAEEAESVFSLGTQIEVRYLKNIDRLNDIAVVWPNCEVMP